MLKCLESQSRAPPAHESSRGPEVQGPIQRKPLAGTKDTVLGSGQVLGLVDDTTSWWIRIPMVSPCHIYIVIYIIIYIHIYIHSQIPHVHPFSGIPMIPCPMIPRHMAPGQASMASWSSSECDECVSKILKMNPFFLRPKLTQMTQMMLSFPRSHGKCNQMLCFFLGGRWVHRSVDTSGLTFRDEFPVI